MLTLDLIRVRHSKDRIYPRYLDVTRPRLQETARRLIETYEEHLQRSRGELDEAIRDLIGDGTDYLIQRGLAKLLTDRSTFAIQSPVEPIELRRYIFETTASVHPVVLEADLVHTTTRGEILDRAAQHFGLTREQIDAAFYADLQDAYILTEFDPLEPEDLLHRYNLALAQAILLRASRMEILLRRAKSQRLRQLMRYIKFFRLIASVLPEEDGYRIILDGPLSLFRLSQKYGLQLATFLPALLLCSDWEMQAELLWGDERSECLFELDSDDCALQSHYPNRGVYLTEEEKYFRKRWQDFKLDWELQNKSRMIKLEGRGVLITDYLVRHPDGREVHLEIVGFWRRESLLQKLELLQKYGPPNLILAVSSRLRGSEDDLPDFDGELYFFKDVIHPKRIVEAAERLAPPKET